MAINKNPLGRMQDALRSLNLGTLYDARQGFRRGMQPASEDARSALYKYRDQRGLDEPPQLAEQAARSGLLGNIREIASVAPEQLGVMKPLSGMTFNDEMLRTRLEQGQTIAGNPVMFDEALGTVLDKKR